MEIIDHPSPNHSPRKAGVRVDTVLLHHTASKADTASLLWMCSPTSGVSAHYVIGMRGDIWRLVPESRKAWHAGVSHMPWAKPTRKGSVNDNSIGIEIVNPGDGVTPFTEAQYRALEWLVPDIAKRLGTHASVWPAGDVMMAKRIRNPASEEEQAPVYILGHRDVAPGRKTDPADNFDWGRIREALARGEA
jgi:N-acetylmuramoyl-L-alanine amidase